MGRFFIYIFLLFTIKYINGGTIDGDKIRIVEANVKAELTFYVDDYKKPVETCKADYYGLQKNESFLIYSKKNETINSMFKYMGGSGETCKFSIKSFSTKYAGKWIITTIPTTGPSMYTQTFLVYGIKTVRPPQNPINALENEFLTMKLNVEYRNNSNCTFKKLCDHKEDGNNNTYDLYKLEQLVNTGIERYGACGVRMSVYGQSNSKWMIVEQTGYVKRQLEFEINVLPQLLERTIPLKYYAGSQLEFNLNSFENKKSQLIAPPNIDINTLTHVNGLYIVQKVTSAHEGIWSANYNDNFNKSIPQLQIKYQITVADPPESIITVHKNDQSIHLDCSVAMDEIFQCSFTSPKGFIINEPIAALSEKYELKETSRDMHKQKQASKCELFINKPNDDDFGLWTCSIRDSENVINETVDVKQKIDRLHRYIYQKLGEPLAINCTADNHWDYCRIQRPHSEVYSVTKSHSELKKLEYTESTAGDGVCGEKIDKSQYLNSGNWTCQHGIKGGSEGESTVTVVITEDYVIPEMKYEIVFKKNLTTLECKTFPGRDEKIKTCEWKHPKEILINDGSKYRIWSNETSCRVQILWSDYEDLGTWQCYLQWFSGSMGKASFEVKELEQFEWFWFIILGIVLICLIILFCLIFLLLWIRTKQYGSATFSGESINNN